MLEKFCVGLVRILLGGILFFLTTAQRGCDLPGLWRF